MANLGPQHINQSFGDLLQLPNGLTPAIQNVQDGSGNVTPLEISTTAVDLPIVGPDGSGMLSDLGGASGSNFIGFEQTGTGAVLRTSQDKMRESVSVLDFGADPTGATDSTSAFADAIAASDDVEVPDGTYILSSITGKSNLRLIANGKAKLIHKSGVAVNGHMLKFRDCNNWVIQGFEIDGNKTNQTNSVNTIYVENNSQGWLIDECYIHDAKIFGVMIAEDSLKPSNWTIQNTRSDSCGDSGFSVNGAYRGRFYGCSAQLNASQGFAFLGATSYVNTTDCIAVNNGANGFFYGAANNCTAVDCYSKANGATSGGSGFGFNTSTASTCYKNTLIACIAENNNDDGVDINNAAGTENSDHKIIACRFEANNSGINCINSSNNLFDGNTIIVSRLAGIHIQSSNRNIVIGNRTLNNGSSSSNLYNGIYIDGSSNYNIIDANVSTNDGGASYQKYGIYVDSGATQNTIINNDTSGNATGGINDDGVNTVFDNNKDYEAPSFFAYQNISQNITDNTETKATFTSTRWNVRSLYSTTLSRFTPKQTGRYQINATVMLQSAVDQKIMDLYIKKNGSIYLSNGRIETSGTGYHCVSSSVIVDVTSPTDYFEVFVYQNTGGTVNTAADPSQTFFCGHKLPQ